MFIFDYSQQVVAQKEIAGLLPRDEWVGMIALVANIG